MSSSKSSLSKGVFLNDGIQKLHHCSHCNQGFSHRQNMYRHEKLHIDPGLAEASNYPLKGGRRSGSSTTTPYILSSKSLNQTRRKPQYRCDLCGDIFASNWRLQHHIQQQHSDETPYKCRTCQKPYASRRSMIKHMATHDPRTYYSCPFCPDKGALGYSKRWDLNRHLSKKHPGIPRSHLDAILDTTRPKFTWRAPIDMDDDNEEGIHEPIMPKLQPFDDQIQEDYDSNSNSSFPNFHQGVERNYENENQNQKVDGATSAEIIELWPERKSLPHKCRICGKGFAYIQNKKRHEGFHENPGASVNSMLATRGINIKDKIRKVTQPIPQRSDAPNKPINLKRIKKRVNCKYCGKTLADIWTLRNHVQAFHSSVMNYKCVHCSKPYASKDSLRKHEQKHFLENLPTYRCSPKLGCNIAFGSWDEYVMHCEEEHPNERFPEAIRNSKSKTMVVSCDVQDMRSEDRNGDPICDICGKVLKNWFMVQRHKKAIHGTRPFKCRYCERRFGLASSRTNHEHIHIGKRPKPTAEASSDCITLNPRRKSTPPSTTLSDVRIEKSKMGCSDEGDPVRSMKGNPYRCPNCDPGHPGFISLNSLRIHFTKFPKHYAKDSVIEVMGNRGGGRKETKKLRENLTEILPNIQVDEVEAWEDEEEVQQNIIKEEEEYDVDKKAMIPMIKEEEDAEPIELDNEETEEKMNSDAGQIDYFFYTSEYPNN